MVIVVLLSLVHLSYACIEGERPNRLGTHPTTIPAKQGDLRVVTYNIYCWNACPKDYAYVKDWLSAILPTTDVIAFQEFECHECSWYAQARRWLENESFGGNRFKSVLSSVESVDIWVNTNANVLSSSYNGIGLDVWGLRYVLTTEVQINGMNLKFANHHGCLGARSPGCRNGGQPAVFSELGSQGFFNDGGAHSIFLCDCNDMQWHMNAFCDRGFGYQKTQGGALAGYDNIAWGSGFSYMQAIQFDGNGDGGASDHQGLIVDLTVDGLVQCAEGCRTCDADNVNVCTSCPAGQVLNNGNCEAGLCDESSWPDLDHGLVCGDCKVLVDNFDTAYGSCDGYCSSIGKTCVGAWDEVDDTCSELTELSCDQTLDSSDAICQCSAESADSDAGDDSGSEPQCDESSWPDLDHGLVCGECKVLVNNFDHYGTCNGYCGALGMGCRNAWEEADDTCTELYSMSCDQTLDSSDAICECDPSTVVEPECGYVPSECQSHIDWALSTGRNTNPHWYSDFEALTGASLSDATMEDMTLYFNCKDSGHLECENLRLPCGRTCLN